MRYFTCDIKKVILVVGDTVLWNSGYEFEGVTAQVPETDLYQASAYKSNPSPITFSPDPLDVIFKKITGT